MKLALIGFGAMGQLIARLGRERGDEIGLTLTSAEGQSPIEEVVVKLKGHDVAIDFSAGGAVLRNVEMCAHAGVPLVEGTTGWKDYEAEARRIVTDHNGAMVYGANFSIGVNVFYRVVSEAARMFCQTDYGAFIEEEHHSRKKDAPSGTALKLKELMSEHIKSDVPVASVRAGHMPGTHKIGFDSVADQITLTHTARSREGFALGALTAASWIIGKKGVFEFSNVFEEMLSR